MRYADAEKILGLGGDYSLEDVKRAYRAAAKRCHPDSGGSPSGAEMATVNEAYETVQRWYDAFADVRNQPPSGHVETDVDAAEEEEVADRHESKVSSDGPVVGVWVETEREEVRLSNLIRDFLERFFVLLLCLAITTIVLIAVRNLPVFQELLSLLQG